MTAKSTAAIRYGAVTKIRLKILLRLVRHVYVPPSMRQVLLLARPNHAKLARFIGHVMAGSARWTTFHISREAWFVEQACCYSTYDHPLLIEMFDQFLQGDQWF